MVRAGTLTVERIASGPFAIGQGDTDYVCGQCGSTLLLRVDEGQVVNISKRTVCGHALRCLWQRKSIWNIICGSVSLHFMQRDDRYRSGPIFGSLSR